MKFILIGVFLFALSGAASAQPIFKAFEGAREIIKVQDIKKEDADTTKLGKPCGDYFLYEQVKNTDMTTTEVVSFQVPISTQERNSGISSFIRVVIKALIIEYDDKLERPTAEWKLNDQYSRQIVVKISNKDFEASDCLSKISIKFSE